MHPEPATIEGDLAATPGPIRLVRLRLSLALVAMAFIPVALSAPILSTALDGQRAAEQAQADRDATSVARSLDARLGDVASALQKTGASSSVAGQLSGTKGSAAGAKAALAELSGDTGDGTVAATLLDARGRQVIRAVGGKIVKPEPTLNVDPLVGAALSAERGAVETGKVGRADDGTAHLAMATPIMGGARSATPIGVVRVEVSLDRLVALASAQQPSGGAARLVDHLGNTVAPVADASQPTGPTITSASALAERPDWSVRLLAPTRLASPPLPLVGLLVLFVTLLAILIFWMARQVLRPAEELAASRGRLQDLYELARVDSLRDVTTGLGNHRAFQEAFERQVDAARTRQASVGLVLIDLDDFRAVNDSGGHAAGDEVLAAFGRLVQATLRPSDRAFRTGGDEFAVLLPGATIESAAAVARRLLATSMEVRPGRGEPAPRSFSAGVSAFPAMATDRRQLLDQADTALTWAKRHGRTSVESFDPARHRQAGPASDAPAIEQTAVGVAEVIARRLLRPVYQPIVDLKTGRVVGSEGLIRPMPGSGFANPGELFTAAELAGRTVELDFACLEIVAAGAAGMGDESILTHQPLATDARGRRLQRRARSLALVRRAGLDPDPGRPRADRARADRGDGAPAAQRHRLPSGRLPPRGGRRRGRATPACAS